MRAPGTAAIMITMTRFIHDLLLWVDLHRGSVKPTATMRTYCPTEVCFFSALRANRFLCNQVSAAWAKFKISL